eukprot:3524452-Pleurochrysis_carterae.AAC.2
MMRDGSSKSSFKLCSNKFSQEEGSTLKIQTPALPHTIVVHLSRNKPSNGCGQPVRRRRARITRRPVCSSEFLCSIFKDGQTSHSFG